MCDQGERYTAVFIGPGGTSFYSLTQAMQTSEAGRRYVRHLNRYLVDAYAMLVKGEIQSEALGAAAEAANLFRQGKPRTSVVTRETVRKHGDAIEAIVQTASSVYEGQLGALDELLRSTTPGRQGCLRRIWR